MVICLIYDMKYNFFKYITFLTIGKIYKTRIKNMNIIDKQSGFCYNYYGNKFFKTIGDYLYG